MSCTDEVFGKGSLVVVAERASRWPGGVLAFLLAGGDDEAGGDVAQAEFPTTPR